MLPNHIENSSVPIAVVLWQASDVAATCKGPVAYRRNHWISTGSGPAGVGGFASITCPDCTTLTSNRWSVGERRCKSGCCAGAFEVRVADPPQHLSTSLLRHLPAVPLTPHLQRFVAALYQLQLPLLRRSRPPARKAARSRRAVPRPRLSLAAPPSPPPTLTYTPVDTLPQVTKTNASPSPRPPSNSPSSSSDSADFRSTAADGVTASAISRSAAAMHAQEEVPKQEQHARAAIQRGDSSGAGAERDGNSGPHAAAAPPALDPASPGAPAEAEAGEAGAGAAPGGCSLSCALQGPCCNGYHS